MGIPLVVDLILKSFAALVDHALDLLFIMFHPGAEIEISAYDMVLTAPSSYDFLHLNA